MLHQLVCERWLFADPLFGLGSLIGLIIVGAIIIFVAGVFIFFLPAFIVAGIVWWISRNETLAGIAFLLVALVSLTRRR